jgi:hypothetical protein
VASASGLLNFFERGLNCGALEEQEVLKATNLSIEELRTGSFAKIVGKANLESNSSI